PPARLVCRDHLADPRREAEIRAGALGAVPDGQVQIDGERLMAEIVNLRLARKDKARADKDATAAQNRALFGRSKAETSKAAAEKALAERTLAGHRRSDPSDPKAG